MRMEHWPIYGIAENLGEDRGEFFININDFMMKGIEDLPGIFKRVQAFDLKRVKLAMRKYKRLRGRRRKTTRWLRPMARCDPGLFAHWQFSKRSAAGR